MSETNTPPPVEEYIPRDVLSSETNEDATKPLQIQDAPPPNGEADDKPEPTEAEREDERRRTEKRREAQRIGYLTKQRYAEKARADALEQRLRAIEQQQNPGATEQPPSPEQLEQWVDQRATQKLAAEQHQTRVNEWDAAGIETFGQEKFRDACKTVAEMASEQQRRVLLEVAMDTEGGARAVMAMAEDAEAAERILALPPHRMALAIAKLAADKTPAAKAVSNAPPPVRPPTAGRARGEPDPEHGDMDAFMRWSAKQPWRR
jgi:hypothetical protein